MSGGGREGVEQAERAKSERDKVPTNHPPDADGAEGEAETEIDRGRERQRDRERQS